MTCRLINVFTISPEAGKVSIVICDENMFCHSCFPLFKSLRRFRRVSTAKITIKLKIMNVRITVAIFNLRVYAMFVRRVNVLPM